MQAKSILLSVFSDKSDSELHELFTLINDSMNLDIDSILINESKYVKQMSMHEISFNLTSKQINLYELVKSLIK